MSTEQVNGSAAPPVVANPDAFARMLHGWFRPTDFVSWRIVEWWTENGRSESRFIEGGCELLDFIFEKVILKKATQSHAQAFVAPAPRFSSGEGFDHSWQIRQMNGLIFDADHTNCKAVWARLKEAKLPPPTATIMSGTGVHGFYRFVEPYLINDISPPPEVKKEWGEDRTQKPLKYYVDEGRQKNYLSKKNPPKLSRKARFAQYMAKGLAKAIGSDSVHDLARELGWAGSINFKNFRNGRPPVLREIIEADFTRTYSPDDFAYLAKPFEERDEKVAAVKLREPRKQPTTRQDRLRELVNSCACADVGQRSDEDFALLAYAIEWGFDPEDVWRQCSDVSKFRERGREYFDGTWANATEKVQVKVHEENERKNAKKAGRTTAATTGGAASLAAAAGDVEDSPELQAIEADDNPHRLARIVASLRKLLLYRGEIHQWTGKFYRKIPAIEFRACVTQTVKEEFDRLAIIAQQDGEDDCEAKPITVSLVSNVVQALQGMIVIPGDVDAPFWLEGDTATKRNFLACDNGLLNIDTREIIPHDPRWFSPNCLTYPYLPGAACPTWSKFFVRNLEADQERIDLLQEWFGYCLTTDTSRQKFMMLVGEGKNGKSVLCSVLTAMLGAGNVSAVALEEFAGRFNLLSTLGKLANITAEVGELDKVAEGKLKSFTGGDRMTFDRKGLPLIEATPTAKLTIATNNPPRIADRSSGLWRRLIKFPLRVEIADSERIHGMDKPGWWEAKGELPGILAWALDGLERLNRNDAFTRSKVCDDALSEYQEDNNPVRTFLTEVTDLGDKEDYVICTKLYSGYRTWCAKNGIHALANNNFGKEVFRAYPQCWRAKVSVVGIREWSYFGILTNDSFLEFMKSEKD